ncbi:hypothetical protein S7711_11467 [Stachybotrys chartarum IBT 7711]|uniref:Uncharacterized protein n=1 Tax=Stachybotrys chartarum (strain CBS 109288 / IBT 7711) TaxID=1280523 RepID=A0A084B517_STACB|nr:hypothetical protein S7711_11467 [Stachybotrys chartarum IBT 7711]
MHPSFLASKVPKSPLASLKKKGFKSVAAAKRAGVSKRYEKYHRGVDNLRKKLEAKRLERAIVEFHKNIHGEEIAQQLKGIRPCKYVLAPRTIEYELEERTEVAELFSQAADVIDRGALQASNEAYLGTRTALQQAGESTPSKSSTQTRETEIKGHTTTN